MARTAIDLLIEQAERTLMGAVTDIKELRASLADAPSEHKDLMSVVLAAMTIAGVHNRMGEIIRGLQAEMEAMKPHPKEGK